jgi:Rap1a immunity proteins
MTRSALLGAAALALTATMAGAAEKDMSSANFTMRGCRDFLRPALPTNAIEAFDAGNCAGIVEGINFVDESTCMPKGVTAEQSVRVVVAYIDARPARMHESFKSLALEALRAAWPCR